MRRKQLWAAAGLLTAALALTTWGAGGSANASVTSHATTTTSSPLMQVRHTPAGTVLANSRGFTVYYYLVDKRGSGRSACTGSCAVLWPPVLGPVRIPAGVKLPGAVGYIKRPGGARQLTIGGWPVYTYVGDHAPGQSHGEGIGGIWYVIKVSTSR